MELTIGPVPSRSVVIWIAYARNVLAQAVVHCGDLPSIDPAVVEELEGYLDEWERGALRDETFVWRAETDPERLPYLAHTFLQIVEALDVAAVERGFPISPPEGDDFYQALVSGIVASLEVEGPPNAAFSEQLRDRWPGLKEP